MKRTLSYRGLLILCSIFLPLIMGAYQAECFGGEYTYIVCGVASKSTTNNLENDIVGTWEYNGVIYEFNADHTMKRIEGLYQPTTMTGTWELNGTKLTTSKDDGIRIGTVVALTNEWLRIDWEGVGDLNTCEYRLSICTEKLEQSHS